MGFDLVTVHAGHNAYVQGANSGGYKEHVIAREFKDMLIKALNSVGQKAVDCTDDIAQTVQGNLSNIVLKCNNQPNNRLDVSIHLNAFNGQANGVEVWYYDQQNLSANISKGICDVTGMVNRGAKQAIGNNSLYVISNTNAPSILIELAFIDNASDMKKLMSNKQAVVNAIVKAITGKNVGGNGNVNKHSTSTPKLPTKTDTVPIKRADMVRLAKFIDTTDPKLVETLKKDGYRVVELPKK